MRTYKNEKLLLKKSDAVSLDAIKNVGLMTELEKVVRHADPQLSLQDVVWALLNKIKANGVKKNDLNAASTITWQMARLCYLQGGEWRSLMQQSYRELLMSCLNNKLIPKVQISSALDDNVCDECKALHGKTFTIREALEKMPLPPQNCEWCRCTYLLLTK